MRVDCLPPVRCHWRAPPCPWAAWARKRQRRWQCIIFKTNFPGPGRAGTAPPRWRWYLLARAGDEEGRHALQPQSACIICLHHAALRHADAEGLAPCEKRWRIKVAKERAKAGLWNIWDLALRSCRWVVGLLNVWGGKAPPRGTFAQSHWSWSGRGLKSPSYESWQSWPCVSLNAESFFCLEGATGPAKPPSVPALDCTDCRFFFSSALYKIL